MADTPGEEIKNPYLLEFLGLKDEYSETELEDALIGGESGVHRTDRTGLQKSSTSPFSSLPVNSPALSSSS
jgi:hypothetical protein